MKNSNNNHIAKFDSSLYASQPIDYFYEYYSISFLQQSYETSTIIPFYR